MSVIAWRCWRSDKRRYRNPQYLGGSLREGWESLPAETALYSVFRPFMWDGPTASATAYGRPLGLLSSHGLHSLKKEYLHPWFIGNAIEENFVIGQVELTGVVVEHRGGWRSERQTVVELHVPVSEMGLVRPYEERYQCSVYVSENIWDFFLPENRAIALRRELLKEEGIVTTGAGWEERMSSMPDWASRIQR